MRRGLVLALLLSAAAGAASAAQLPGVVTPSGNIHCFVVPVAGTTQTDLICNIQQASYGQALAQFCSSQPQSGLDWKGFELAAATRGKIVCAHGALHRASDTLAFRTLRYGHTWRHGVFTCVARTTGMTCTNRGHGLFVGRSSYKLY